MPTLGFWKPWKRPLLKRWRYPGVPIPYRLQNTYTSDPRRMKP